jgi:hypothetical protein
MKAEKANPIPREHCSPGNMLWDGVSRATRQQVADFIDSLSEPSLQRWATDLFSGVVAETTVSVSMRHCRRESQPRIGERSPS